MKHYTVLYFILLAVLLMSCAGQKIEDLNLMEYYTLYSPENLEAGEIQLNPNNKYRLELNGYDDRPGGTRIWISASLVGSYKKDENSYVLEDEMINNIELRDSLGQKAKLNFFERAEYRALFPIPNTRILRIKNNRVILEQP